MLRVYKLISIDKSRVVINNVIVMVHPYLPNGDSIHICYDQVHGGKTFNVCVASMIDGGVEK